MKHWRNGGIQPFSERIEKKLGQGFYFSGREFVHHTNLTFDEIAFRRLSNTQKIIIAISFLFVIGAFFFNWYLSLLIIVSIVTVLYFSDLLFQFFLVYKSYFDEPEIKISAREIEKGILEWPMYTILCPLYKEWEVLPQFVDAMKSLDYPEDKLQIMLLLESNDKETIRHAKKMALPKNFDIVVVPHSLPKTKPKALNYGIEKAKGEYIVIYDAEDIPQKDQLKKAVLAFKKAKNDIICIQAKLNFYNASQNVLTRLFTLEYSLWFDLVLTGLHAIQAPIPLGGTSNHFRTKDIIDLKKWDPFNVTEDADLGMRIVKRGSRTAIMNSYTMEEANSHLGNWFKQRSRWIKGYIQTYFVHMRRPHEFFRNWRQPHFVTFQLVIGGKVVSMLVNPILWAMTITYFVFYDYTAVFIESLFITPIFYMGAFCLFIGNFLYMYYYMLGATKRNEWDLVPFALLTPLYWLAMSGAAFLALWEFIVRPHYWHKTKHGLHLKQESDQKEVVAPELATQGVQA